MVNIERLKDFVIFVDSQIHERDRAYGRRARIFLINESTGEVYRRSSAGDWEAVPDDFRPDILQNICSARENRLPVEERLF